ncbi:MAG: glycosyl transferase, partial [Ottowia sp.]|nr:glycosyl transferase [Ottowia sp.]
GFAPLRYAEQSSLAAHLPWLQRPAATSWWLADWMANRLLPAWLLLAAVALVLRLGGGMPASVPAANADAPAARL